MTGIIRKKFTYSDIATFSHIQIKMNLLEMICESELELKFNDSQTVVSSNKQKMYEISFSLYSCKLLFVKQCNFAWKKDVNTSTIYIILLMTSS